MSREATPSLYGAMTLGAGVGLLAARVMQLDLGMSLVVGALVGIAGAVLEQHTGADGGPTPGDRG
jgi:hypothetical protein